MRNYLPVKNPTWYKIDLKFLENYPNLKELILLNTVLVFEEILSLLQIQSLRKLSFRSFLKFPEQQEENAL